VEGGYLPPEGRSGVAAEYEHNRLLFVEERKLNRSSLIDLFQRKIRSGIADLEGSSAGVGPQRFKGIEQECDGCRNPGHHSTEDFRRLMHRPPDEGAKRKIDNGQSQKNCDHNTANPMWFSWSAHVAGHC